MTDKDVQPWQWPEAHWRRILNQARAGRALRPKSWPDGARCAFALSFDSDHETNEMRDGGKSIGRQSWGQYRTRVGKPRNLVLQARHDVRASFYVPAVTALIHREELMALAAGGHEIGFHGLIDELISV